MEARLFLSRGAFLSRPFRTHTIHCSSLLNWNRNRAVLLRSYRERNHSASAHRVDEEVPTNFEHESSTKLPIPTDSTSLSLQIDSFERSRRWKDIVTLFEPGYLPKNIITSDCAEKAIHALGKAGRPKEAIQMFKRFNSKKRQSSSMANYNSVILAFANTSDWKGAVAQFEAMRADGIRPNIFTINSILRSFVKDGPLETAVDFIREYTQDRLKPNIFSYNILIDACAKRGDAQTSLMLFESVKDSGLKPDKITYTSALNACSKAGDWENALVLFSDMLKSNVQPDIITWNRIIDALLVGKQLDLAMLKFNEMQQHRCYPDVTTYNCLINAAGRAGDITKAEMLFREMNHRKIYPDVFTYCTLINAYADNGLFENSMSTFNSMISQRIVPDLAIYTAIIKSHLLAQHDELAMRWVKKMRSANILPDFETWRKLTQIAKNESTVDYFYSEALRTKVVVPYTSKMISLISNCEVYIDVHGFNVPMAKAAVRHELEKNSKKESFIFCIVTGWGKSGTTPVIKDAIIEMLTERQINFDLSSNPGIIIVEKAQ